MLELASAPQDQETLADMLQGQVHEEESCGLSRSSKSWEGPDSWKFCVYINKIEELDWDVPMYLDYIDHSRQI